MSAAATKQRAMTYEELINDKTWWDISQISTNLDVQMQTVRAWRRDALAAARKKVKARGRRRKPAPHPNHLPPPDIELGGKPAWYAGTIRKWAIQTGRMTNTGQPKRLKPPGRPRKAKTDAAPAVA